MTSLASPHGAGSLSESVMNQTRRTLLTTSAAASATAVASTEAFGQWRPSERYPDPAVQVIDPAFNKYRIVSAAVERIATGMRWCEGPIWFGDGRYLLWSDIPNNAIMRWDEITDRVSAFRKPS